MWSTPLGGWINLHPTPFLSNVCFRLCELLHGCAQNRSTPRFLVEDVVSMFGMPEALPLDRGTNVLCHLMQNVCKLLGIRKLNTTAYHLQCNDMAEWFNRTLKTILWNHAARLGAQWDWCLPGVLCAYRNTPHSSTGEKSSFLLLGNNCGTSTEAC